MEEKQKITSYRDLLVWQKSKSYAVLVYKVTEKFPSTEIYGLVSQMRRAAVSIPSNIAEGFRRGSKKEKLYFIRIAYGSGAELETQLEISHDLGFVSKKEYEVCLSELDGMMRMMNGAIRTLEK